jgi:16S rRNA (uracil1498-N3)-methyltransferase
MKQSQRAILPEITECTNFKDILSLQTGIKLIADIEGNTQMNNIKKGLNKDILVLIGPEGGFSGNEIKLALENGFSNIKLSEMRLRSETAAIIAVSSIINLFHS